MWKGLLLTAGVKNLFDKDPPFSNQGHAVPERL
jgi:iron complex outermembrane receptor protein